MQEYKQALAFGKTNKDAGQSKHNQYENNTV